MHSMNLGEIFSGAEVPSEAFLSEKRLGEVALGSRIDERAEKTAVPEEMKLAKQFVGSYSGIFSAFAGDSTLSYKVEDYETFYFAPKEGVVGIPLKWFRPGENGERRYTTRELVFSGLHEISHFLDMRMNPQEFLKNFDRMKKKADELAEEYVKKYPDEAENKKRVRSYVYGQMHTLYNCLDDIYVNRIVKRKAPTYENGGDGASAIVSLYEKLGFEQEMNKKDSETGRSCPKHLQMAHSLLRDAMIGDERGKSIIDDDVEQVLENKFFFEQSIRDVVDTDLSPGNNHDFLKNPEARYAIIGEVIEPEYIKLLWQDLDQAYNEGRFKKEKQPEEPDSGSDGDGESGDSNDGGSSENSGSNGSDDGFNYGDDFEESPLSNGDDEEMKRVLRDIIDKKNEDEQSPQENKVASGRAARDKFYDKNGINELETRAKYESIEKKIAKTRDEMRDFWRILVGKSIEYQRTMITGQTRGNINMDDVIENYPELQNVLRGVEKSRPHIYERAEYEPTIVEKPELIEVSLLVDCSGSMSNLVDLAKQTAILLTLSLKDFNHRLEMERGRTHSGLHVDSEVIRFEGKDEFSTIKHFNKDIKAGKNSSSEDAEIVRMVDNINAGGGTDDGGPLEDISNRISPEERQKIKNGKIKKIVFEITDGYPQDKELTKNMIAELEEQGVVVIAFQVGSNNDTFREIWNSGPNPKGVYLGDNVEVLPKELLTVMKQLLKDVRL